MLPFFFLQLKCYSLLMLSSACPLRLPTLIRIQSKASDPGDDRSPTPDAALSLGMAFVEAAGAKSKSGRRDGGASGTTDSARVSSQPRAPTAAVVVAAAGGGATVANIRVVSTVLSQADQLR